MKKLNVYAGGSVVADREREWRPRLPKSRLPPVAALPSSAIVPQYLAFLPAVFLLVAGCAQIGVLRPRHYEAVSISDIPDSVMETFGRACPHAELVGTWKYFAGDQFIFYVFRFRQDDQLQETSITPPDQVGMTYHAHSSARP